MKSNVKENIGYFSIAIVLTLTLVLSVVAIDTYQNNNIVANAQFDANGEHYSDIPIGTYILEHTQVESVYHQDGFINVELDYEFVPRDKTLYFISFDININNEDSLVYYSYLYVVDSYAPLYMTNSLDHLFPVVGASSFAAPDFTSTQDLPVYGCYMIYDDVNETFWLVIDDTIGTFTDGYDIVVDFYLVENDAVSHNFLSYLGDGINFGFQSIASGITYTMDNLFIVDDELTNFSVVIFLMTGISLALSVLKFVLNFIFSFGGKD